MIDLIAENCNDANENKKRKKNKTNIFTSLQGTLQIVILDNIGNGFTSLFVIGKTRKKESNT